MIKERMEQRGTSVSWFARQLCCERTNVYSIYRRSSVDTALLVKISRVLEYDFFAEISRRSAGDWMDCHPGADGGDMADAAADGGSGVC